MREFNKIFQELVKHKSDFVGMVAYSIYKKEKYEFIMEFVKENGRNPTEEEINIYHKGRMSEEALKNYKEIALQRIQDFSNEVLKRELDQAEEEYNAKINKVQEQFNKTLQKLKPSFFRGVWQSLIGAVFFVFLTALVYVFWIFVSYGPKDFFRYFFGKGTKQIESHDVLTPASNKAPSQEIPAGPNPRSLKDTPPKVIPPEGRQPKKQSPRTSPT